MNELTPAPDWLISLPIAHRAYHDISTGRAENSMSAFRAAVEAGFAIECDVQMSANGEPVVFHDPELERMTKIEGLVRETSPADLAKLKLLDTDDGIHLLKDHLALVNNAVPVIVELKGIEGEDDGFMEGVAEALTNYDGRAAVMSFDHWICAQFASSMPNIPRGLTAAGGPEKSVKHERAMHDYDLQFVSYHVDALPNPFVVKMREAGLPAITWTVRTDEQRQRTSRFADQMTFEGFDPRKISGG